MIFAIFDEAFYLASYPDVAAAVAAGVYQSGFEHFQQFGLKESRVLVSKLYDEQFYLNTYPDVAAAVATRSLNSGLEHFIQWGETEGRSPSPLFDEAWYRRRYPDVAAAIGQTGFSSGLQHYIIYGEAEGRSGTTFNEFGYRQENPDVANAIAAGAFTSGLEHYLKNGQFENRQGVKFTGTSGNDTVTGFGAIDELYGVDISPGACVIGGTVMGGECLVSKSFGVNEVDVLRGGTGQDTFVLGTLYSNRMGPFAQRFYVGGGDTDYAILENFEPGKDKIQLVGQASDYLTSTSEGNSQIYLVQTSFSESLPAPDLVAIVPGVTSLNPIILFGF
jgi:hypothetical protein